MVNVKKHLKNYMWVILFVIFSVGSYFVGFKPGLVIYSNFNEFFIEMISFIPFLFIIIGLFDVWLPKEMLEKHIGRESGVKGIFFSYFAGNASGRPVLWSIPCCLYSIKKRCVCTEHLHLFRSIFIDEVTYVGNRDRLPRDKIYNFENSNIPTTVYIGRVSYGKNRWQ
jgi:hypothetical protein